MNDGYGSGSFIARRYNSLTGVWTPSVYPQQTEVVTKAEDLPVSLALVKNALPVFDNADDNYITLLIEGVTEQIRRYLGRDIAKVTRRSMWWRPYQDNYLAYGPHGVVTSVVSQSEDGIDTTLVSGSDYYVQGLEFKRIRLINFGLDGVYLFATYESGYAAADIPAAMKAAIIQEVALQYKNRQDPDLPSRVSVNGLSLESRHLLMPYMRHFV